MAGLPKRQTSRSRRDKRRSHHKLEKQQLVTSPVTGKLVPPGVVCADNPEHKGINIIEDNN